MASLFATIVKNLVLKNGKHTLRIAVTHNGQTRYIPTKFVIDANEIKNGRIVKRADKEMINIQIGKIITTYEERIARIKYASSLTCSQLVTMIKESSAGDKHRTFSDIADEYLAQMDATDRAKTHKLYRLAANRFIRYTGDNTLIESITPLRINGYIQSLAKDKLSATSINIYTTLLKVIINYAVKMRYVTFDVDPFVTAKVPTAKKRDTHITVEQLKAIRDANITEHNLSVVRDIFMLTYYLAGMNLVDLLDYNFKRTGEIRYIRKKTRHTKEGENEVCFTIPDEAKPIIARYMDKSTGKLIFGRYKNYTSCYNVLARKIKKLAEIAGIRHYFTLYSARKSFVQHGFDLGIPLSTLEYCIGQSMKDSRPIFNYVTIMQRHADKAIREILDNLK